MNQPNSIARSDDHDMQEWAQRLRTPSKRGLFWFLIVQILTFIF